MFKFLVAQFLNKKLGSDPTVGRKIVLKTRLFSGRVHVDHLYLFLKCSKIMTDKIIYFTRIN